MRKIYLTILAFLSWAAMSVASFAIDVIVVSHGQANDPFWSVAKNGVDSACKDMKSSVSIQLQVLSTWLKWQN